MAEKKGIQVHWNKNPGHLAILFNIGDFSIDPAEIQKIGSLLKEYDPILGKLVADIDEYAATADDMLVKSPEHEASAILFLKPLKTFRKSVEDTRKKIVKPIKDLAKDIDAIFKPRLDVIDGIERKIKDKLRNYRTEVEKAAEKERQRVEEQNRKKAERHAAKVEKAIENGKDPSAVAMPVMHDVQEPEKTTKTAAGSASYKTVKKFRIIDQRMIPIQYFMLDEKKIGQAVKIGIEIPGIEVYEDKEIAIR